ncbi:hypothetical protein SDC9_70706 [bioreactor metagenome]|uniref:DUF6398 domain-containing protein n=1 Tax=bioreactor metagenome TaxID=1076179 RepID=A0A644Y6N6_9ZZZZ
MKKNIVPKSMEEKYKEIISIINSFCIENLNGEYAKVCKELCAALSRKRPSPLIRGRSKTWACGIVHAIGTVNFLFDSTASPYIKASDLYEKFGVSNSTGSSKSKEIQEIMDMVPFDPAWTLPSRIFDNPFAWLVSIEGVTVDLREAPRELQELAYNEGVIPFIPDDRNMIEDKEKRQKESKIISFEDIVKKKQSELKKS